MNKILTIIIPTYNMEKYLRRCLDSLIIDEEGMKQLEVLVINDGSKDSSSQIAHEYQDKYPDTYRVIDKENGNYGSCINRGLKEATGKYVKVLDADDWFDQQALADVLERISNVDVDLVLTAFKIVNPEGGVLQSRQMRNIPANEVVSFAEHCAKSYQSIWMHSVTYRLKMLLEHNYTQSEGISYTDNQWVFSPMAYVKKVVYFPQFLYLYMLGREGQSMDPKIVKRSTHQFMKMVEGMIRAYILVKPCCDPSIVEYLNIALKSHIHRIYRMALIERVASNEEIKQFDESVVCINEEVRALSSSILMGNSFKFQYIEYWRERGRKPLPTYIIACGKVIKELQILKKKIRG